MAACRDGCSISSGGGASPVDSLMFEVVRNRVARGGRLSAAPQFELKHYAWCFGQITRGLFEPGQTFDLIWNRIIQKRPRVVFSELQI